MLRRFTRAAVAGTRRILDVPAYRETLLHKTDLPSEDPAYLTVMDWSEFRRKFGASPRMFVYGPHPQFDDEQQPIPRKFAAVLALDVRDLGVVPIPFILDTGAPLGLYLGTKALDRLRKLQVIEELVGPEYPYLINDATLCHGEKRLTPVLACAVPYPHETEANGTLGHVCCNILGIQVLWKFRDLLPM